MFYAWTINWILWFFLASSDPVYNAIGLAAEQAGWQLASCQQFVTNADGSQTHTVIDNSVCSANIGPMPTPGGAN